MKILVPSLVPFSTEIAEVVSYDPSAPIPNEHTDAQGIVIWGVSDDLLADAASRLRALEWVQLLSAGSDAALAAGFGDGVAITSGRSLHDAPVAEHALALILAAARRLHTFVRAQIGHRWASELGGIQPEPSPGLFSTLRGANVVIWGYGSIGSTLALHLRSLGAYVTGVATRARTEGEVSVITTAELPALLPATDVLVMILPSKPETERALDANLIDALPPHAWLVNCGRGTTVDEPALIDALRGHRIGGAALDVTSEEPLPPASELWDLPNAIITPHAAGGRPLGAGELINHNLQAHLQGSPLRNLITPIRKARS